MANLRSISKKIKASPKVLQKTRKIVEKGFEKEKQFLLESFESHPVTRELIEGPEAGNSSGTLMGYGNLFGFIGFSEGASPISPVRQMLNLATRIKSVRRAPGSNTRINININVPDLEDFREIAPLPWEPGRSWVEGIERGISGLGYYLNLRRPSSRSGGGVQIENKLRVMAFKNTKYMSEIIRNFTLRLRNLK